MTSTSRTAQRPLGSGFGAHTTAAEVLDGINLTGKHALITGGYSGIGLETTRALADAGATITVPARRPDVAQEALAGIPGVTVASLDLADLDSVAAFADKFLASGKKLDIVILSAAIMANPYTLVDPGWESQFATNHLGHFALVNRLWPAIADGARIVAVSSRAHAMTGIRWDDLHSAGGYERWQAYGQSKTANALFAFHLDRLGEPRGIRAFTLHPGIILTPLQRQFTDEEKVAMGWIDEDGVPAPSFKTVEQGAATQVWAATSPMLNGMGGVYLIDCDIASPSDVEPHARDAVEAERLWALSAGLTGVDAFAR